MQRRKGAPASPLYLQRYLSPHLDLYLFVSPLGGEGGGGAPNSREDWTEPQIPNAWAGNCNHPKRKIYNDRRQLISDFRVLGWSIEQNVSVPSEARDLN